MLELMYKLMEYRSDEVRHRLEKVGRAASMLHMDVLLLIYHFAKFSAGNILEIGPYIGGSTVAAAFGARESRARKKEDSEHRSRRTVETLSAVEQGYHQGFAKKSRAIRRSGRRYFDQRALLRRSNYLRSSSPVEQRRCGPVHFRRRR